MENQVINITINEADCFAIEYFTKICGFQREGEKYKRLMKQGMEIKSRIEDRVNIRAIVSSFSKDVIFGNTVKINDVTFVCNAFEQLNRNHITNIYAYILTSGNYDFNDDEPIMNQLYADIWGTAYVDAALEILKNTFKKDSTGDKDSIPSVVLDPFGPGFYGMDVDQVGKFFEILDSEKIGVKVRSNNLMLPLKSCAGFFIVVDDESQLPSSDCKSCHAEHKGCAFCQAVIKGKIKLNN